MSTKDIRLAREAVGMNRTELAKATGIATNTLWRYETGRTSPTVEAMAKITAALGVVTKREPAAPVSVDFFDVPVLVNVDDWMRAKDGRQYRAIWGVARLVKAEEILGFKPTNSANWGLLIGEGDDSVFVAGCRIHYMQRCPQRPADVETLMLGGAR